MQFDSRGPPHPGPLPKERERSSTVFGIHWTVTSPATAKWFSLSLRERAGVRGKRVSNCMDWAETGTPYLRRSSDAELRHAELRGKLSSLVRVHHFALGDDIGAPIQDSAFGNFPSELVE